MQDYATAIDLPATLRRVAPRASALHTAVLSAEADFDALREEWDRLLERSEQCSFFLRWSWNRLWWRTYAPPRARLFIITCRDDWGELVGLAPFYLVPRSFAGVPHVRELVFLGTGTEIRTSEHLDVFALGGFEGAVAAAVAATLRSRNDWDRLRLWGVPGQSKFLPLLAPALGAGATTTLCDRPHYIAVDDDWDAVKSGFAPKFRRNLERSAKLLFRDFAVRFERVETAPALEEALADFVRLHQARWMAKGHGGSFALPRFEGFLHAAMRDCLTAGRLRLWTLRSDERCVAVLLAFVDNGVAHYFQGGFDPDPALSKYSVGSVTISLCIQDCLAAAAVREFDFMGGEAGYKAWWTRAVRESFELECLRPGFRSTLFTVGTKVRRLLGRARRIVKQAVGDGSGTGEQ